MIIILLVGIILAACLWTLIYRVCWSKELSVELFFQDDFVYAGESTSLTEVITNEKVLPIPVLEVAFQMPTGIRFQNAENSQISDYIYRRDIFAMLGNQRITRTLPIVCEKRGFYEVSKLSCLTYSLLYGRKYVAQTTDTGGAGIYVYAKRTNVSDITMLCETLLGEAESNRKMYEDPFSFASIREYTVTDPMKAINWKASAKTGGLMVNTYTSVKSGQIMIFLDVEDGGIRKQEDLVENSISLAATLSQKMLQNGFEVGFCVNLRDANGEMIYFAPSKNKSQLGKIERVLAKRWKQEEVGDFDKMCTDLLSDAISKKTTGKNRNVLKNHVPVFISKNVSLKRKDCMEQLIEKGNRGIWVIPVEKGESCLAVSSKQLLIVKRQVEE